MQFSRSNPIPIPSETSSSSTSSACSSPRSVPSSFSSSGSPPRLDASTLALLDTHFSEKAEAERLFQEIACEQAAAHIAGIALGADHDVDDDNKESEDLIPNELFPKADKPMMSVADFRLAFNEDWQLSQFWYSEVFATKLATHLHALCTPSTQIAFMCCPTGFVAFQRMKPLSGARLLEFDQRFAFLSPKHFVPYDLDNPDAFPVSLKEKFDIAVVDPPFLNAVTNKKLIQTLRQILNPNGKLILITSTSVEDILFKLYDTTPLGPLKRTPIEVDHGRLANDFACWGSWDGAEYFGKD